MLEALKFASRGVARRDLVPSLLHYRIAEGRVTGTNGVLALSSPLTASFAAGPLAVPFLNALNACEDVISITKESDAKLIVKSGSFKANVPCIPVAAVPIIHPEGIVARIAGIRQAFAALKPFISTDENRPWACGVRLAGNSIYATNNVTVAEYWLATPMPTINVPVVVIDEVLRVKEDPTRIQVSEGTITFHYSDGRWIKSALNSMETPDIGEVFNRSWDGAGLVALEEPFRKACEKLAAYDEKSTTIFHSKHVAAGEATVTVAAPTRGAYYTQFLADVLEAANAADFEKYPSPVPWAGEGIRGILMGLRE